MPDSSSLRVHFKANATSLSGRRRIRVTLPHIQSIIALYTRPGPGSDQQETVVGRVLTAHGHVHRWQVLSTSDRRLLVVYRT